MGGRKRLCSESLLYNHGFTLGARLGEGTFSNVKHCTWRKDGERKHIAVKIIDKKRMPKNFLEKFLPRELDIITKLNHENVIEMFGIITLGTKVYIAMEWASRGDLLGHVRLKGPLAEDETRVLFNDACRGVSYLHSKEIVHRDLKCENLLLCVNNRLKIADFGFSRILRHDELSDTFCGSSAYTAPEILQGKPYVGTEADIWSLGVILYIMICSSMPFRDTNITTLLTDQRTPLHIPSAIIPKMSLELGALLLALLTFEHEGRITMSEIVRDTWMTEKS